MARTRLISALIGLILAPILAPSIALAKNVALVIGNSSYKFVSELENPENDARAVSQALGSQGFDVMLALDVTTAETSSILREFRKKADSADFAMVYYAGHGIEIAGENYIVPIDSELADERDASVELIRVNTILDQISSAGQMKMMVLDACRNNPFAVQMKRENRGRNVGRGLSNIETAEPDTLIAYAAAAGEITPDGEAGGNSPFTSALLTALEGPPMDVRRLLGTVRDEMRKTVPGAAPFVYSSLGGGEYVINPHGQFDVPPSVTDPLTAALPAQNSAEMLSGFLAADQAGTVENWNGFLLKYRDSMDSEIYRAAMAKRSALVAGSTQTATEISPARTLDMPETRREAVLNLQTFLRERKCYWSSLDGIYGPKTRQGAKLLADRAQLAVDLPSRPDIEDLALALSILSKDENTLCPVRTTNARSSAVKSGPPKSTLPQRTAAKPAASAKPTTSEAAEPSCISFEGQSFCN